MGAVKLGRLESRKQNNSFHGHKNDMLDEDMKVENCVIHCVYVCVCVLFYVHVSVGLSN
jgi:hypothetical protein